MNEEQPDTEINQRDPETSEPAAKPEALTEMMVMLVTAIQAHIVYLDKYSAHMAAHEDVMTQNVEINRITMESIQALTKIFDKIGGAINEHSARLDQVIARIDSYFGGEKGLDYDN